MHHIFIYSNGIISNKPVSNGGDHPKQNGGVHFKTNSGVHNKSNGVHFKLNNGVHFKLNGGETNFPNHMTTFSSPKLNGLIPSIKPSWSLPVDPATHTIINGSSSSGGLINKTNSTNSFAVPNCQNYYVAHSCSHQGKK